MIRRATSAASRSRKPTFAEIFTACYTTILGTAAVLDARHKDNQREDLDRRLKEARGGLNRLKTSARPATGATPLNGLIEKHSSAADVGPVGRLDRFSLDMIPAFSLLAIDALKSICKSKAALIRHSESLTHHRNFLQHFHKVHKRDEPVADIWQEIQGTNFNLIQQAQEDEQAKAPFGQREPMTPVQFERFIGMINLLVDSLILEAYRDEHPGDPEGARRAIESLDSAWTAIRMLRSDGYPRYNHPDLDPPETHAARERLNKANRKVFASWRNSRAKFLVARICYNLLVSSVPPGIHNYNALMLGFTRVGRHNLAGLVVDSLLENSRLRPTKQTIVCLLLHHRSKCDLLGFYDVLRRLMAIDNRGMLQRRRWYEDVQKIPDLRTWANEPEVVTSLPGNWFVQRPQRDHDIYEAIVAGLLDFGRIKDAAKVFVAALSERWGISVHLMFQLIKQCLHTLNKPAAGVVIRGFLDNLEVITSLLLRDDCPRKTAEHVYPLFALCAADHQSATPAKKWARARAPTPGSSAIIEVDTQKLQLLFTALFVRDTEHRLHRLSYIARRMKHIRRGRDPVLIMDSVCRAINEFDKLKAHYTSLAEDARSYERMMRVRHWIRGETWALTPRHVDWDQDSPRQRTEQRLRRSLPHVEPGEIRQLAQKWMRYRLSRQDGIVGKITLLKLQVDLGLSSAKDLEGEVQRTLRVPFVEEAEPGIFDQTVTKSIWPGTGAFGLGPAAT